MMLKKGDGSLRKKWGVVLSVFLLVWITGSMALATEPPTIVVTFRILEDFTVQVAGAGADVRCITPEGAEIHEWALTAVNCKDLEEADLVLYNGLNLEQWMDSAQAVSGPATPFFPVGEMCGYPTLPVAIGQYQGEDDPHLWMDVQGAISYVETIRDILVEKDPCRAACYRENASSYVKELLQLHQRLEEIFSAIPKEQRILITNEAAFTYLAQAYGFSHDGIWGTNTEEEGTPRQILRIHEIIWEKKPPAIFWESTGSDRYAQAISQDTGVPVFGPLYVDSMGERDTAAGTYLGMMEENARLLLEALGGQL